MAAKSQQNMPQQKDVMLCAEKMPKDALVMTSILRELGVPEYEPRVVSQMLEFTYRYITNILEDARALSGHAKKPIIDLEDVRLAIELQKDKCFTTPPLREVLMDIAIQKNSSPLPLIKATAGPRLPPDRYNLTSCNYRFKLVSKKQRIMHHLTRPNVVSTHPSVTKLTPQINIGSKVSGAPVSVVSKAGTSAVPLMPRHMTTSGLTKSIPTPIIKTSDGSRGSSGVPTVVTPSMPTAQIVIKKEPVQSVPVSQPEHGEKRKREDTEHMDCDA